MRHARHRRGGHPQRARIAPGDGRPPRRPAAGHRVRELADVPRRPDPLGRLAGDGDQHHDREHADRRLVGFAGGVAYITGKDKITYAFDLTTGALIWKHGLVKGTAGDVSGTALVGNTVYLGSDTGVYALNATTGATVWHVITNRVFYASPAIVGPPGQQVLITANITGHIFALDLATGKTLWTQTADSAGIWSSPAVSQNTIYITGKDGQLVTFAPSGA